MTLSRFQVHCFSSNNDGYIFPTKETMNPIDLDNYDCVPRASNGFFWLSTYKSYDESELSIIDGKAIGSSAWREYRREYRKNYKYQSRSKSDVECWITTKACLYTIKPEYMPKILEINTIDDYFQFLMKYSDNGAYLHRIERLEESIKEEQEKIVSCQQDLDAINDNLRTHYQKYIDEKRELPVSNLHHYRYTEVPSQKNKLGSYYGACHMKQILTRNYENLVRNCEAIQQEITSLKSSFEQFYKSKSFDETTFPDRYPEIDIDYEKIIGDGFVGIYYSQEFINLQKKVPKPFQWYPRWLATECLVVWKWIFEDEVYELVSR